MNHSAIFANANVFDKEKMPKKGDKLIPVPAPVVKPIPAAKTVVSQFTPKKIGDIKMADQTKLFAVVDGVQKKGGGFDAGREGDEYEAEDVKPQVDTKIIASAPVMRPTEQAPDVSKLEDVDTKIKSENLNMKRAIQHSAMDVPIEESDSTSADNESGSSGTTCAEVEPPLQTIDPGYTDECTEFNLDIAELTRAMDYIKLEVISQHDTDSETTAVLVAANTILAQVADIPGKKVGYFHMRGTELIAEILTETPQIKVPERAPMAVRETLVTHGADSGPSVCASSSGMISEWSPSIQEGVIMGANTGAVKKTPKTEKLMDNSIVTLRIPRKKPGKELKLTFPKHEVLDILEQYETDYDKGIAILRYSKLYTKYAVTFRFTDLVIEED